MLIKGLLVNHTIVFCLQDRSMSSDCMGLELHYFCIQISKWKYISTAWNECQGFIFKHKKVLFWQPLIKWKIFLFICLTLQKSKQIKSEQIDLYVCPDTQLWNCSSLHVIWSRFSFSSRCTAVCWQLMRWK